jgi:hypothetical protein
VVGAAEFIGTSAGEAATDVEADDDDDAAPVVVTVVVAVGIVPAGTTKEVEDATGKAPKLPVGKNGRERAFNECLFGLLLPLPLGLVRALVIRLGVPLMIPLPVPETYPKGMSCGGACCGEPPHAEVEADGIVIVNPPVGVVYAYTNCGG